jgi:hypothetical protein
MGGLNETQIDRYFYFGHIFSGIPEGANNPGISFVRT